MTGIAVSNEDHEDDSTPSQGIGIYPGNTNPAFIHLMGTVVSWWARIEGLMIHDITALRTWPFSGEIVERELFPKAGKNVVKQWRKLINAGFRFRGLEVPKLDGLVNEALLLLEHRNNLVHSFWPYGQSDPDVLELHWIQPDDRQSSGVARGKYVVTVDELDRINTRLAHLYTAVMVASFNSHVVYREPAPLGLKAPEPPPL